MGIGVRLDYLRNWSSKVRGRFYTRVCQTLLRYTFSRRFIYDISQRLSVSIRILISIYIIIVDYTNCDITIHDKRHEMKSIEELGVFLRYDIHDNKKVYIFLFGQFFIRFVKQVPVCRSLTSFNLRLCL